MILSNAVHDSFVTYLLKLDDVKLRERTNIFDFFGRDSFHLQTQQKLILNQYQQY